MGLPVGADFVFHTDIVKAVPPYATEDLTTVVYENTPMPLAPTSLGGVMLQLVIDSDNTTIAIADVTVDATLPDISRTVAWGDGVIETGLGSGALVHTYEIAGTYYVRFTDCLVGISIVTNVGSSTPYYYEITNLRDALRHVIFTDKVTSFTGSCFQGAVNMDQEVLVLPGIVSPLPSYTFGSIGITSRAVRVLSMPSITTLGYYDFYANPSIEILCVDNLNSLSYSDFWSTCPYLKWVLVRNMPCSDIQSRLTRLFNDTAVEGHGLVGSDGYIMNKTIHYDN